LPPAKRPTAAKPLVAKKLKEAAGKPAAATAPIAKKAAVAGQPAVTSAFAAAMTDVFARGAPWPGVVAVSGGSDSLALMFLLADWARAASKPAPVVLTVDHGLNDNSERVARDVLRRAKAAGLTGELLVWKDKKPKADIEAAAREARYRLIGEWCHAHKVGGVYAAHTLEDQAETFLLRLGRGSGLDGLSAMRPVALYPVPGFDDLRVVRPLLDMGREQLRGFLKARKETWVDDPMNADPRFARARLREAWPMLGALGLSSSRIAGAARHLARAREALDHATENLLARASRIVDGEALLDPSRLAAAPREIGLRAFAWLLSRVSGEPYRPRFERLERLYDAICRGELVAARTLHGCLIAPAGKVEAAFGVRTIVIAPELSRKPAGLAPSPEPARAINREP
jgi:tRNA(Ile)-lysidine synthase